jgi:hypothetical protein
MKIGDISSASGRYNVTANQKPNSSDSNNTFKQSITLDTNTPIDLGTINGKPFEMHIMEGGGFQWSGAIRIKDAEGKVTPEQAAAAYAAASYTTTEHEQAGQILATINKLYLITKNGQSTDPFNDFIRSFNISQKDVENALNRLGFNSSEPFTVNGRTFIFNSGTLKDYENVKMI